MSAQDRNKAKEIFLKALERPAHERSAFLEGECSGDEALRRMVTVLLDAHEGEPLLATASRAISTDMTADEADRLVGTRIGPHKLLELIGEGGFGAVYVAEQEKPVRRRVALKVIKLGMDTRQVIARFEAERQALAMMDHPNIARVLDAGATDTGRPWFAMELVRGVPITEYCDAANLPAAERLALFIDVCFAVQHAHQKGVIHRDIKPSNVLVTLHDGKPVPKVIDFGIAKAVGAQLTDKTVYTQHRQMIGTPAYMAPEQAEMSGLDVDTRADVYSLGVLLYELLTGAPPFTADQLNKAGWVEMQRIIREVEPVKPSTRVNTLGETLPTIAALRRVEPKKLSLLLRGDLDWISMKCLEKDRARRYGTATDLAADVQRHLAGEPVVAAPPGLRYRIRKFVKRNRGHVIAASAIASALALGTIVSTALLLQKQELNRELSAVNIELTEVVNMARSGLKEMADKWLNAGHVNLSSSTEASIASYRIEKNPDNDELHVLVDFVGPGANKDTIRSLVYIGVNNIDDNIQLQRALESQRDEAEWSAYAANLAFAQFAMSNGNWSEAREPLRNCPETRRGWEWRYFAQLAAAVLIELPAAEDAIYSSDGKFILTRNASELRSWDASTGEPVGAVMKHDSNLWSAEISPDGKHAVAAANRFTARVWSLATGKPVGEVMKHDSIVLFAAFSPDGKLVVTAAADNTSRLWNAATGKPVGEVMKHDGRVYSAKFNPDGKLVVTTSNDHTARLWNAATGAPVGEVMKHDTSVYSAEFSLNGKLVVTVSDDKTVRLWDVATGAMAAEIKGGTSVEFSPDGNLVATTSYGHARLWNAATGKPVGDVMRHDADVNSVEFSPDGKLVVTASNDKTARLWDAGTGEPVSEVMWHGGSVWIEEFSPDGRLILTSSEDGMIHLWDLTGRCAGAIHVTTESDECWPDAVFSPNGQRIVVFGYDENEAPIPVKVFAADRFDQPEKRIAAGADCALEIKALMIEEGVGRQTGPRDRPDNDATFDIVSPDGTRRVTAHGNRSIRFADAATGRVAAVLSVDGQPTDLRFTPDGTRLIAMLEGGAAVVWDTREPAARQADRDARNAEHEPAKQEVERLLAGTVPMDRLDARIRSNNRMSPGRKLAALSILRRRLVTINAEAKKEFDAMTKEHITASRVRAAAERWSRAPVDGAVTIGTTPTVKERSPHESEDALAIQVNPEKTRSDSTTVRSDRSDEEMPLTDARGSNPNARRIREALLKKAAEWTPALDKLNELAWEAVKQPGASTEGVHAALDAAREALSAKPEAAAYMDTLGAALYRAGQFEAAIDTLARSSELIAKSNQDSNPANSAFIAMSHYQLGRHEELRGSVARLKDLLKKGSRIEGRVDGRSLVFRFSEKSERGEGWFDLAKDGQSFAGNWRNEDTAKDQLSDWTGKRKAGRDPNRFDGLWDASYGDMWLFTDRDAAAEGDGEFVRGFYGIEPYVAEAIMLIEGALPETPSPSESPVP